MPSVFREHYWWTNPKTGKRVRKRTATYRVKYRVSPGVYKTVYGYGDKESSLEKGRKLERRAARQREGIYDPVEEHESTQLSEHVEWFGKHLAAKDDCPDHVARTTARVKAVIAGCEFKHASGVSATKATDWLAGQRKAKIFGKRTSNYYLAAFKAFCRWMVKDSRTDVDRMAHVSLLAGEIESTRERRAATADEFSRIIEAARASTNRRQIHGVDRAMLYMLAAYTGLRAQELSSITPESFDLAEATVTVGAGYSKRRRTDCQPLRSDLVEVLRDWLKDRPAGKPLWPGKWFRRAAEMLKADLEAAGVAYVVGGRVLDFHALRHTYITLLHRGGTYGKVLQSLARHSTPMLTARYTHVDLSDLDAALSGLPAIPKSAAKPKRRKAV